MENHVKWTKFNDNLSFVRAWWRSWFCTTLASPLSFHLQVLIQLDWIQLVDRLLDLNEIGYNSANYFLFVPGSAKLELSS